MHKDEEMKTSFESMLNEACSVANQTICAAKSVISEHGIQAVDMKELGEAIDIVKDVAGAKKDMYEACYYEKVTEAMEREGEEPYYASDWSTPYTGGAGYTGGRRSGSMSNSSTSNSMQGYNMNRYANGRYAPSGSGRTGYMGRGGYTPMESNMYNSGMADMDMDRMENDLRHGVEYRDYSNTRRYYTETKDPEAKREMDEHAKRHVLETVETIREIYRTSDPELKKKIKEDITKLVSDMM